MGKKVTEAKVNEFGSRLNTIGAKSDEMLRSDNPIDALSTNTGTNPKESGILAQVSELVNWLITELNCTVRERGGDSYDYKREFKSPKAINSLRDGFLKAFVSNYRCLALFPRVYSLR